MTYTITRQIGIDAGHRIATHGSKCRHLHGHRYTIEAVVNAADLHHSGEQTDMALDFGFLKEEMLAAIDAPCDHGLILCVEDADALMMLLPEGRDFTGWHENLRLAVTAAGFCSTNDCRMGQKLYLIPGQPTAECLARHWYERLAEPVRTRSDGLAALAAVTVWETPNCRAEFKTP